MDSRIETTERAMRAARQGRLPLGNGTNATAGTYRGAGVLGRTVLGLLERTLLKADLEAAEYGARCFVPFRDFYGGWFVYQFAERLYRTWMPTKTAREWKLDFTLSI